MAWNRAALAVTIMTTATASAASSDSPPTSPQAHVAAALAHAASVPKADRCYLWYLSFWDTAERDLMDYRRFLSWWLNQMSFERAPGAVHEIEKTGGRLLFVDIRDFGWNCRARDAVGARDPFTREPWIFSTTAHALRDALGIDDPGERKDGTRPLVAMVNATWLIRETIETRRSTSYYDLLYAKDRFPGEHGKQTWRTETRTVYHGGGDYRYPDDSGRISKGVRAGTYQVELKFKEKNAGNYAGFVDFPKNVKEFESAFGIDVAKLFGRNRRIDLDFGVVVEGGRDNPRRGSIVALNNRLVVFIEGPLGLAMRTYDVFETTGKKDYSELLFFKEGKFVRGEGVDAKVVSDGGELLYYLPNGGQAGFLINGKGDRVEVAVADVANDQNDRLLNQGVRNPGSCTTCHGGTGGYISPRSVEEDDRRAGIKRKFKDPEVRKRYEGFFDDLDETARASVARYERLVKRTTRHPYDARAKAWTGSDVARMTGSFRDAYDAPVDATRGARMLGVSGPIFRYVCSRSPNQRPLQLLQGREVPSVTFEKDVFGQLGLLLDAYRENPEYRKHLSGGK